MEWREHARLKQRKYRLWHEAVQTKGSEKLARLQQIDEGRGTR
jgi:hypothetical protein